MRWKEPTYGDKRVIKRFLLIPRTINGETRWLERANIMQKYILFSWKDMGWIDKEEYMHYTGYQPVMDKRPIQKPTGGSSVCVNPTNKPFPGSPQKQPKRR